MEIDLLIDTGAGSLVAAEFKLTKTPGLKHAVALEKFRTIAGPEILKHGYVVCSAQKTSPVAADITIVSLAEYLNVLEELTSPLHSM